MEHYFIEKSHKDSDYFEFSWQFLDNIFTFKSCDDVFSKNNVDYGTYVLLRTIAKNITLSGNVLDIGCGYGVIGIVLAKIFPKITVSLTDVNETALQLTRHNVSLNNVKNYLEITNSFAYQNVHNTFDFIISNPPIKAGKKVLLEILTGAYDKLNPNGSLIFVIKKKFGEDSIKKQLSEIFSSVAILERDSGYYILQAKK